MFKEELKKQLEEAIASKTTTDTDKELLVQVREELKNAKNEKQYFSLLLKLIELIGVLAKVFVGSSG